MRCWKDACTAQCGERVWNTHLSILEGADYLQEGTDARGVGPTQDLPRHAVLSHPAFVPSLLMGFLDTEFRDESQRARSPPTPPSNY